MPEVSCPIWGLLAGLILLAGCLPISGCTFFRRAASWPALDPLFDEEWYRPAARVAGKPANALPISPKGESQLPGKALADMIAYARNQDSCALLVLHKDRLVLERYWCGMDRHTRFNAWSMAKTVTALAVGQAIESGAITSVDDPLERYLPEWADDPRGQISLRHLLQMRAGLRLGNMIRIHLGTDAQAAVLDTPLVSAPGADFKYSNVNTMLLSIVLTRATGQRYVEFLSEQLWKPLGAQDAAIWLDDEGGIPKTYCCLLTTARDWARVGLLLLHRGRVGDKQVVPAAWIEQMLTPSPTEENYGYHIWLGYTRPSCRFPDWTTPFESADSYMLVGRDEQRVFVVPAHQLVIVRIGRGSKSWDDPVLPNIAVRALRETSSLLNPTGAKARK